MAEVLMRLVPFYEGFFTRESIVRFTFGSKEKFKRDLPKRRSSGFNLLLERLEHELKRDPLGGVDTIVIYNSSAL